MSKEKIICPDCGSDDIKFMRYRKSEKYPYEYVSERYYCLNQDCERESFSVRINEQPQEEEQSKSNSNGYKYEEKKDSATIETDSFETNKTDKVKILDDFLGLCQVDLETWEVEKYTLNAWDVTMSGAKSSTNKDTSYTNYQIKVWLRRRQDFFDKEKFTKELIEDIKKNHAPNIKADAFNDRYNMRENNLFIPNLYDVHLGRLCWHEESNGNYDVKIAIDMVEELLVALFNRVDTDSIHRILFPIGNDFLNYDYAEPYPMTTNGTPQEADVRWQKMFRLGRNLLYSLIDWMYQNVAPVDVVSIPGNHEEQTMYYLSSVLEAKYENNNNVTVDNNPVSRKYYKYGTNLIGFAHGKDEKETELHNLMSLEAPHDWAGSKYRYYYLEHNHHERSLKSKTSKAIINQEVDYKGVMISYMPSIAQTDKYEHKKGYEGSIRGARGMLHNYDKGRIQIIGENI